MVLKDPGESELNVFKAFWVFFIILCLHFPVRDLKLAGIQPSASTHSPSPSEATLLPLSHSRHLPCWRRALRAGGWGAAFHLFKKQSFAILLHCQLGHHK